MADQTINAVIRLLVEGGHLPKEAAQGIRNVGNEADKTKPKLSAAGNAAKEFGNMVRSYLGAAAIGSFIRSSATEFAALDRQLSATLFTMQRLGVGGKAELDKARGALEALAAGGGPLLHETIPAFQKFVGITKNVDSALAAVSLASDVSEAGITDFGSAISGVTAILQGKGAAAARNFGIELRKVDGSVKTNKELLQELQTAVGGVGDAFNDSANDLDKAAASWERVKLLVGKGLAPALKIIPDLITAALQAVQIFGARVGVVFDAVVTGAENLGGVLAAALNLKKLLKDPAAYGEAVKLALDKTGRDLVLSAEQWEEERQRIVEAGAKAQVQTEEEKNKALKALADQAGRASLEDEDDKAKKAAEQRADFELDARRALLQARLEMTKEGSREELEARLDMLALEEQAALAAAEKAGAADLEVRQAYLLQRLDLTNDFHQKELEIAAEKARERAEKEAQAYQESLEAIREARLGELEATREAEIAHQQKLDEEKLAAADYSRAVQYEVAQEALATQRDQELADLAAYEQQLLEDALFRGDQKAAAILNQTDTLEQKRQAIKDRYTAQSLKLEKQQAKESAELTMQGAQMALGALRGIFGNRKEFAIADAIMSTYQGAARAYADLPFPVNIAVSALIVAAGLKHVSQIRKENPQGKGFDDPAHDQLAYLGGDRWAKDLVDMIGAGFGDGLKKAVDQYQKGPVAQVPSDLAAKVGAVAGGAPAGPGAEAPVTTSAPAFTQQVTIGAVYGGDEGMRQLRRELERAARLDANRELR